MNNQELEKMLKSARVPEPGADFWNDLPETVEREARRKKLEGAEERRSGSLVWLWKLATPVAFAALCVTIGFMWGARTKDGGFAPASELAEARACWREAAALFPDQLQAIEFDQQGSRLVLADKPNQPSAPPIFVKMCDSKGCRRFVTFSGQQIKVNGERFEVLVNSQGEVLLVGDAKVWKSLKDASNLGAYRVFARSLANS